MYFPICLWVTITGKPQKENRSLDEYIPDKQVLQFYYKFKLWQQGMHHFSNLYLLFSTDKLYFMDERRHALAELYDQTFINKSDWDKKYLHHKTVRNFIHHYDRIRKENDKAWIYSGLKHYLAF
jgi:hypothetical protein